ncbi:MAG TPA: glycosyltransferase family 39 protein [Trebonia sp.]|nr:glycosyltransferase family 39 protein [Trebonia sp.]
MDSITNAVPAAAPAPVTPPRARVRTFANTLAGALASKAVWLVAAAALAVELAFGARYGYDRDELYFLASGHHLALGGVDQPELTPLLARLDALVTGNTLLGLRALPALLFAAMVLLTAAMARNLGADRRGQLIAALATACCSDYLGTFHELTTTTPDFLCWTVTLLLVTKLLRGDNPRWWLAIGGAAGIGLTAKWNIGFLLAGLLLGFACSPTARPLLRSRYLAYGALLCAVLAAPDFVWQARHGWPNFAVFSQLQTDAWTNRAMFWPNQILYTSIVEVPLWIAGAAWALRSTRYRALGIATVTVICLQFVLGGKPYYPDASYTFLFAAGATALFPAEPDPTARRTRWLRRRIAVYGIAGVVSCVVGSLPVLPASALARFPVQKINYDLGEQIGWPTQVKLLATVWNSLPSSERSHTALIASNYGEAGAVDRYGSALGLPQAYSGDNNFWFWGPPPADDTTAVVISDAKANTIAKVPAVLSREFSHVTKVAVYHNGLAVSDDEEGAVIYVATGLRTSWATAWPAFRIFA